MPKTTLPCEECGKSLERWPSNSRIRKYGAFCNRDCLGLFRSRVLIKEKAANYKTGSRRSRGYIEVEAHWHPCKNKRGYISLHRLIIEARLGRILNSNEVVHHIDHNPRNNHWDNLAVMTQSQHARLHIKRDAKTGRITGGTNT